MGENREKSQNRVGKVSRRDVIKAAGVGAGAVALGRLSRAFAQSGSRAVDLHLRLYSREATVPALPGAQTGIYQYIAGVKVGDRAAVQTLKNSLIGPIIRVKKGQRVAIDYVNNLPEDSVVHFHGLHVPEAMDGHPIYTVTPGGFYRYQFQVINRAGTYWFHAHPDMRTGFQANRGQAGFFLVSDPEEAALNLPRGSQDLPICIQDKRFSAGNQIQHSTGSTSGHLGNRICVNGYVDYVHSCGTRHYRLRLLNGSNSRIYKLAWGDGRPMKVIGTSGGLIDQPIDKPYVMLAPGDRVEVWLDLTQDPVGTELWMKSLAFDNGGPGSGAPSQGTAMDLFKMRVDRAETETLTIPTTLTPIIRYQPEDAVNFGNPRTFALENMGMWTINGRTFSLTGYEEDETVHLNDLEIWEFRNDLPGDVLQPHPMHLHGAQFQIIERTCVDPGTWYASVQDGYVDEGWHDTILLFPGERVKFMIKYTYFTGLFLYHCHNLEHEDMGMMRNYCVLPAARPGNGKDTDKSLFGD